MNKKIVLAGGYFWGMQELIRKQPGVVTSRVGYTGGGVIDPTYENHEGHAEVVEIEYDTEKTSYKNLLDFFFQIHNPTTLNQQGGDMGTSYRSAIFYTNEENEIMSDWYRRCREYREKLKDAVMCDQEIAIKILSEQYPDRKISEYIDQHYDVKGVTLDELCGRKAPNDTVVEVPEVEDEDSDDWVEREAHSIRASSFRQI